MSRLIWETKHIKGKEKYKFDPTLKYLIYFRGAQSPTHKGHYETVKRFLNIGENVKVLINQTYNIRHGIPYKIKRKIWKTYIHELLPEDRIILKTYNKFNDIFDSSIKGILQDIDIILYIRGIEDENYRSVKQEINRKCKRMKKYLDKFNIRVDYYYLKRYSIDTLSATEFTRQLIRTRYVSDEIKYNKCKYFLPSKLRKTIALRIINKLQGLNLVV